MSLEDANQNPGAEKQTPEEFQNETNMGGANPPKKSKEKFTDNLKRKWNKQATYSQENVDDFDDQDHLQKSKDILFNVGLVLITVFALQLGLARMDNFLLKGLSTIIGITFYAVCSIALKTSLYFIFPFALHVFIQAFIKGKKAQTIVALIFFLIFVMFLIPPLKLDFSIFWTEVKNNSPSVWDYFANPTKIFGLVLDSVSGAFNVILDLLSKYFIWASQAIVIALTNLPTLFAVVACVIFSFILTMLLELTTAAISAIPIVGAGASDIVSTAGTYAINFYIFSYLFVVSALIKAFGGLLANRIKHTRAALKNRKNSDIPLEKTEREPSSLLNTPTTEKNKTDLECETRHNETIYTQKETIILSHSVVDVTAEPTAEETDNASRTLIITNEHIETSQSFEMPQPKSPPSKKRRTVISIIITIILIGLTFFAYQLYEKNQQKQSILKNIDTAYSLLNAYKIKDFNRTADEILKSIEINKLNSEMESDMNDLVLWRQWGSNPWVTITHVSIEISDLGCSIRSDMDGSLPDPRLIITDKSGNKESTETAKDSANAEIDTSLPLFIEGSKMAIVDSNMVSDYQYCHVSIKDPENFLQTATKDGNSMKKSYTYKDESGEVIITFSIFFDIQKPNR